MTSSQLKWIAVIAMVIDHLGVFFFPHVLWLRVVGRISFPIFAWSIAQGYRHTHSVTHYLIRLAFFALISQVPYYLAFRSIGGEQFTWNVFVTLAIGLLALDCCERISNWSIKVVLLCAFIVLSYWSNADFGGYGVLLIALFYYLARNKNLIVLGHFFAVILFFGFFAAMYKGYSPQVLFDVLIQMCSLWALVLIFNYSDKVGSKLRWFYWIYPLHLLLIWLILLIINQPT